MVTKEQAMTENFFHNGKCVRTVGPRGGITSSVCVLRRSGMTKTWKTRPEHFSVPIKYGFYESYRLDHTNAEEFHVASECPLLDENET